MQIAHHADMVGHDADAFAELGLVGAARFKKSACFSALRMGMALVDPEHRFGLLHRGNIQIDDHRLLVAPDQNAFQCFSFERVDLLMRHVRRNIDKIADTGFRREFERLAPAHSGTAFYNVDYAFHMPVMMRAGLRIRMNRNGSGPYLLRTDAGKIYGGGAIHPRCLGGVTVECAGGYDPDAILTPIGLQVFIHGGKPS